MVSHYSEDWPAESEDRYYLDILIIVGRILCKIYLINLWFQLLQPPLFGLEILQLLRHGRQHLGNALVQASGDLQQQEERKGRVGERRRVKGVDQQMNFGVLFSWTHGTNSCVQTVLVFKATGTKRAPLSGMDLL